MRRRIKSTHIADSALEEYRLQGSCVAPISAITVRSPSLFGWCGLAVRSSRVARQGRGDGFTDRCSPAGA